MAISDLSLVTKALIGLLQQGVMVSPGWNNTLPVVTPFPPDKVTEDALGLYLYHVEEDAHFKNAPVPGGNSTPVRQAPMGLNLYYQLAAHNKSDSEEAVLTAQQLFGCAVKVLHDYPLVDDRTVVNLHGILADAGLDSAGNVLRVSLQPVHSPDAVSYWTAGTGPTRLAAYYQVTAVMLEPERQESRSGRVLSYGVQVFTAGSPRLDGSRNTAVFRTATGQTASVELRPAQVPFDGAFALTGSGLVGDRVALSIRAAGWDSAVIVDSIAWGVAAMGERLVAKVGRTADTRTILPGTYDAAVEVSRLVTEAGATREIMRKSNVVPIVVTPRIASVTHTGPDAITIAGEVFQHADILPHAVEVYVGATRLAERNTGAPGAGEFVVAPAQIDLRVTADVPRGTPVLLRVLVNGAEAPPEWVTIP